jgi:hypothetical protein
VDSGEVELIDKVDVPSCAESAFSDRLNEFDNVQKYVMVDGDVVPKDAFVHSK